ncbi:hypothetical protein NQ318_000834 [Aromia moschata]|uniref:Superoxide dismutase [Cu-Zn] n=1 Tax=Aromia moschata TaxID=1265417 RepID=A0AAV8X8A3_9CUCU|nr:hypothetical protein NQ318_000834 [Aromia moschata]
MSCIDEMLKFTVLFTILSYTVAQKSAIVYLFDPTGASGVTGNVTFTTSSNGIIISGTVDGLTEGNHGFHIHNLGNIAGGVHRLALISILIMWRCHGVNHGAPEDSVRHVGDLGNIVALSTGVSTINFTDTVIALEGEHTIIGRTVVVHAGEDDLGKGGDEESLLTGNAGGRVACGVIGILNNGSSTMSASLSLFVVTLRIAISMWASFHRETNC